MGLTKFLVVLDKPSETYYGGENVSGRVILNIDAPKKLQCLELKIKGEAHVHWTESRTENHADGTSSSETDHYTAHEQYFEHKFRHHSGGEEILPAGEYEYPFNITLPSNIPSSFEGTSGYIRYTAKAEIFRPWKFNHRTKTAFTVVNELDLNTQESAMESIKREAHKQFGCCCCRSLPLTMVASLPVRGYVPGQEIPVTLEVDNISNVDVTLIRCNLVRVVIFTTTSPRATKKMHYDVATMIFPEAPRGHSETSTRKLKVPAVPPTSVGKCSIIDITYEIKVTAKVKGFHRNLDLSVPVIIGSIPLKSYQSAITPFTEPDLQTSGEFLPSAPPFEAYPNLPSPSYEKCMFGMSNIQDSEDNEYTHGKLQFAPKYPMYNFNTK